MLGERHADMHQKLKQGLEELGFKYVVDEACRLPQLNSVYLPEGVEDAKTRQHLLEEYNLEVGGGLGDLAGKVWRIGLMGYSAKSENVALCLKALQETIGGNDSRTLRLS